MLKELSEDLNSIKNIQSVMKDTPIVIMNNLQGTISRGEEAGIYINDLEHKEETSIQPEQQEEKIIKKNKDSIRTPWDISKCTNI